MTFYLSFTRTIGLLIRGELDWDALDKGLFFFGCSREHAIFADKVRDGCDEWLFHGRGVEGDPGRGKTQIEILHMKLRFKEAMEKAEREGRVCWRTDHDDHKRWEELILWTRKVSPEFPSVSGINWNDRMGEHYCYPVAAEALKAAGWRVEW